MDTILDLHGRGELHYRKTEAEERCANAGITDLEDKGHACIDGAPWELLDRGPDACEGHKWFRWVWPWGTGRLEAGDLESGTPKPEDCPDTTPILEDGTTAGEVRSLSDYRFFELVMQLKPRPAHRCAAVRRGQPTEKNDACPPSPEIQTGSVSW